MSPRILPLLEAVNYTKDVLRRMAAFGNEIGPKVSKAEFAVAHRKLIAATEGREVDDSHPLLEYHAHALYSKYCDEVVKTAQAREDEIGNGWEPAVEIIRAALNMDQVRELNPPENPAKLTDSRASDYVRKFGDSSWELDAIEPRALATLVREAVTSKLNVTRFRHNENKQESQREALLAFAATFKA